MTAVEWERRWARPVALASIGGAVLFLGGLILQATQSDLENDATTLQSFHDHSGAMLGGTLLLALGVLLFSAPLYYLLKAAMARKEDIRGSMLAFAFIGPALIAVRAIALWIATNDVATSFVNGSDHSADAAKTLLDDSGAYSFAGALGLPALIGLIVATVYIPLMATRTGLITRFWGTLGMALGASSILIGPVSFIGLGLWFVYVGLLIGGWLRSGRPPAWDAGEAIPWPVPERGRARGGDGVVEGDGKEIDVGPKETLEPALPEASDGDDGDELGETQGQRRKKRKRR